MREDDGDLALDAGAELGGEQRPDLALRERDRQPERKLGRLGRARLLAQELVPDLRPVPVRDDDRARGEDLRCRVERRSQVGALLGRSPALALSEQRVSAEREDGEHGV